MSKTPDQVKQKILDAAVRDICSVSVAPAAKSEVRGILSTALDRYGEAVVAQERERVMVWVKEQEFDADEEANDPTNDFIAHDAYDSKAEAFYCGYNQAVKEIVEHLTTNPPQV